MTHLTVSQRTLLGRTYQSAQAIASSGTTEENDEFCRTIPIFGANFESCNIFPAEMRFSRLFHTPEPVFSTLSRDYGGVRCGTIPKNDRKMESCDIYGVQNVPKQTKPCDHGKENAFQAPLFMHFDAPGPPIGNRNRESRKCRRLDRNDSYPDIEGNTSRRLPHVNRKHQGNAPDCMMLFRIAVYFQKNEDGMVRFALRLADVLIDVTVQHDYARNF